MSRTQLLLKQARLSSIPQGWNISQIGKSCSIRNDLRKPISVDERSTIKGDYPYYGPTGILDYIDEYLIDGEFALIGEDGDHFLKPQEKSQTIYVKGRFNANNHAHVIASTQACSAHWFAIFFKHRNITDFLSRQGANRYKLNKATLEKLPILLPPPPEQKAIADLLSTWDEAIEKTERLIQAKEASLKGQIQKLISQRCDSWPHVKPKKIFDTITEKNFPEEELLSVTQDRGVIPRSMLEGRVMSPDGTTASYKLIKRGDFAISLRSFQGGIEYSNYQGIISPAYTVLRPKIELNRDFYRLFFKSYIFIKKYLNLAVIGIRDGKQISIPDFLSIKIPVPPIEEQKEIAETLSVCQHEINLLKQLADKYKTQKRGLMQKMLTGEWRVKPEVVNQYE
ncbi:restriction endonuclease subunit S [Desulfobacter latus]|uniref:Restriction endonuclease subunit S n=1 Tax=Desulfobacter latus TaxID=2292 RepID=A0A850SSV6_9BACT|nr:restriction endonuclease subunit S [Desulfobacter latus]NWH04474.1 restriction endonuclease subunit S [Desulfobacter latus]